MSNEIKFLEEHESYYTANIKGREVKLFKIDVDKIDKIDKERLNRTADLLTINDIVGLLSSLENVKLVIPNIEEYETIAYNISEYINVLFHKIEPFTSQKFLNIFHYPYKQINPDIYGKAQTFIKNINYLGKDMTYIKRRILNGNSK